MGNGWKSPFPSNTTTGCLELEEEVIFLGEQTDIWMNLSFRHLFFGEDLLPGKLTNVPPKGTISVWNTSVPTIDFQGSAINFQGSIYVPINNMFPNHLWSKLSCVTLFV